MNWTSMAETISLTAQNISYLFNFTDDYYFAKEFDTLNINIKCNT